MKLRRLIAVARKETLQIWRDPRSLAIALLMPLMQMLLLGYGVSLDIRHVPLCVRDQAHTQASRELVARFVASGWFAPQGELESERAGREAIDQGRCAGVVTIPVDFSRVLATTGVAQLQTVFDATDTNTTNIAIGYAQGVIAQTAAAFEARWAADHGVPPPAVGTVDFRPRVWYNEGLDSRNFIIPGVVAVILALVGAQLTSLTVAREWERGTMELLVSTPVEPMELMIGKLLPYFVIGMADAAICLVLAVAWFDVPFRGTLSTLFFTTSLFLAVVLSIGYYVSVAIRSQVGASQVALLLTMLPTTLLSGFAFPIEQMPVVVQGVTYLVSARYYVAILKAVFLKGAGVAELAMPILFLLVYAGVLVFLAARSFRKTLD